MIITKQNLLILLGLLLGIMGYSQDSDSTNTYKKKVLAATEISLLGSFYSQDGVHSAVGGGIGTEKLTDFSPDIIVNIPMGDNAILSVDAGISAYSSASSSNINPFDAGYSTTTTSGSSRSPGTSTTTKQRASPWVESSGPSGKDKRAHIDGSYARSNKSRNGTWSINAAYSKEYDYNSLGFGAGYTYLFNDKNSELSLKGQVFLDQWKPIYATELKTYKDVNGNLNAGFFNGVTITRTPPIVESSTKYNPVNFTFVEDDKRDSYSASLSFSQVLTPKLQFSIFADFVYMTGLLGTPYHRVYFADKNDFFIEDFQLADDREKLPDTRIKYPFGARINYYISDVFTLRTYYRFYADDWGLTANTIQVELPIKLGSSFTIYPMYRYYTQTAVDYFYPYNTALSTMQYYTSDYDLSEFNSNQIGGGLKIAPPLGIFRTENSTGNFRWKSIELRYNHYSRSDDLKSDIMSFGLNFGW